MISTIRTALQRSEDFLLVSLLLLMILMAVGQIILRNFFGNSLIWADAMVRILVLWVGLLGAMAATRNNNHINIDIFSRFFPQRLQHLSSAITLLFTSVLCGFTAYYGLSFVLMEYSYNSPGFAAIPAWFCESIIPFAFTIIALRCLLMAAASFLPMLQTNFIH